MKRVKRSERAEKKRFYYKTLEAANRKLNELEKKGYITTMCYKGKKCPRTGKIAKSHSIHAWR